MQNKSEKINWQNVTGLIIYPIILLICLFIYLKNFGLNTATFVFILLGHYITNIGIGVGLHRYWAHSAFKTNKFVEFIMMLLTAGAIQGPVIAWVSDHYKHHTFTDEENDPHSPLKFKNRFLGFMWSHIGWMLYKNFDIKKLDRIIIKRLGSNKLLTFQLKNYWKLVFFMHIVPPFLLGYVFNGQSIIGGLSGILFIGLGRVLQQHMTFCINSVCHFFGTTPYANITAKNVWWLAYLMLGENYHNFHHVFPNDYRNGEKWYHFDAHKWIIYFMSKVGLAWDLNVTSKERIQAKINQRNSELLNQAKEEWINLQEKCNQLISNISSRVEEIEKYSKAIKASISNSGNSLLNKIQSSREGLDNIMLIAKDFVEDPQKSTKKAINKTYKKFSKIEKRISLELNLLTDYSSRYKNV